jgi:hypothetical protein
MADNKKERGPGDRARINVNQEHELRYWTQALGVAEPELRRAVGKVGPMADDVRRELGKS